MPGCEAAEMQMTRLYNVPSASSPIGLCTYCTTAGSEMPATPKAHGRCRGGSRMATVTASLFLCVSAVGTLLGVFPILGVKDVAPLSPDCHMCVTPVFYKDQRLHLLKQRRLLGSIYLTHCVSGLTG